MNPAPSSPASESAPWEEWHIPFSQDLLTLRQARESLARLGARQEEIPLMVQLVENPRFDIPGIDIFHGAVDLRTHDAIHILLGRGLLAKDEAFVIGFTMGSTNKVSTLEENLFALFTKHLYPKLFRFDDEDIRIFRDACKLGYISDCQSLSRIDYERFSDWTLRDLRSEVGLENDLILAYYRIEQKRHPTAKASQRLLR